MFSLLTLCLYLADAPGPHNVRSRPDSLALASLLLLGGRLGDRSGHKRVYLAGLGIFGVGSALCAVAPSMAALNCFRVLQGIGAAIEMPATLAILSHTFTGQRQRAQAVGIWAGAVGTSLVIGPVLGGWLTDAFGWPAIFIVNLPVTALVVVLTLVTVREAAAAAGLRLVPLTIAFVIAGPLVGRVIGRVGHQAPMAIGCALMAAGCLLLLPVTAAAGYAQVAWPFAVTGIGYGLTSTPMAAAVLGAVPRERAGMASATNLTARVTGGVFGVAVLGALLPAARTASQPFAAAFSSGLHTALIVASVVAAAAAAAAAAFIRPGRPR